MEEASSATASYLVGKMMIRAKMTSVFVLAFCFVFMMAVVVCDTRENRVFISTHVKWTIIIMIIT